MKKLIVLFVSLFLTSALAKNSYSQDAFDQEAMQKWMAYMTPGEVHMGMANYTGAWKTTSTMWMAPNTEPTVSQGTATAEMILGGRYLVMNHSGNIMGMPFEGMSIEGYDNATKTYNSVWIDNMGTGIMYMTGLMDPVTNQINYTGKMVDCIKGGYTDVRTVVTLEPEGSITFQMYVPYEGVEFQTMNLEYSR